MKLAVTAIFATPTIIPRIRAEVLPHDPDPNPNGPDGMIKLEDEEKTKPLQERYGRDKDFPDISDQLSESSKA